MERIQIEIEKDLKQLEQLTGYIGVPEDVRDLIQNAIWNKATELDLSYKRLTSLPPEIAKLTHLRKLDLSINQLTSLPLEISELENLEILDLRSNQLRVLPGEISKLGKLKELDLRINRLTGLPDEIAQLTNLTLLRLEKNLLPIPSEILEQLKQPKEIVDYYLKYRDSTFEKRPLSEAKVILVGEGGVGKTSLVNRLLANRFDPHEIKTEGINIQRYHITVDDDKTQNIDVWLNLWDFGGQEIMHATHQFFLTKRSLYILVLDARRGEQESRIEYWLKLIRSFAGNSPIIVACNKSDEHQLELDWTGLEKKYPNIRAFIKRMSCQTGEGIRELNQLIEREVAKLEHINDPLLVSWFAVKTQLEEMEENYISYQDYQELCRSESILDEASQRTLIGFLHDLGIILHFQDHPILEDTNVLNPEWVTKAVYQILNSSKLAQNKGVLDITDLNNILDLEVYPRDKYPFVIDMMHS